MTRDRDPELRLALEEERALAAANEAEKDKAIRRALTGDEYVHEIAERLEVGVRRVMAIRDAMKRGQ